MAKIGIHIRLSKTICDVASYAASLEIPLFQCFLIQQETNQFIQPSQEEIATFVRDWRPKFDQLYVHGSYWINLAAPQSNNRILLREMELAKKLEFTHIICIVDRPKEAEIKKRASKRLRAISIMRSKKKLMSK